MKNILKPLVFHRENELESRWWHRLIKVLIYGSTIAVFSISIIFFINHISSWNNPDPKYVYSFESKYSKTYGFSKSCTFNPENNTNSISINCGNINQKWSGGYYGFLPDFLDRYARANSYKEEFLIKDPECISANINYIGRMKLYCNLVPNYQLLNQRIEQGEFNNIQAKRIIILPKLLTNITLMLLIPLLWFFLLKSVIYKAFVYIILGKKK